MQNGGTPQLLIGYCRLGYAQVKADNEYIRSVSRTTAMFEIDHHGLDQVDRKLLTTILQPLGGPVNGTIAAAISEKLVLLKMFEPYLMQLGFARTEGRVITV